MQRVTAMASDELLGPPTRRYQLSVPVHPWYAGTNPMLLNVRCCCAVLQCCPACIAVLCCPACHAELGYILCNVVQLACHMLTAWASQQSLLHRAGNQSMQSCSLQNDTNVMFRPQQAQQQDRQQHEDTVRSSGSSHGSANVLHSCSMLHTLLYSHLMI